MAPAWAHTDASSASSYLVVQPDEHKAICNAAASSGHLSNGPTRSRKRKSRTQSTSPILSANMLDHSYAVKTTPTPPGIPYPTPEPSPPGSFSDPWTTHDVHPGYSPIFPGGNSPPDGTPFQHLPGADAGDGFCPNSSSHLHGHVAAGAFPVRTHAFPSSSQETRHPGDVPMAQNAQIRLAQRCPPNRIPAHLRFGTVAEYLKYSYSHRPSPPPFCENINQQELSKTDGFHDGTNDEYMTCATPTPAAEDAKAQKRAARENAKARDPDAWVEDGVDMRLVKRVREMVVAETSTGQVRSNDEDAEKRPRQIVAEKLPVKVSVAREMSPHPYAPRRPRRRQPTHQPLEAPPQPRYPLPQPHHPQAPPHPHSPQRELTVQQPMAASSMYTADRFPTISALLTMKTISMETKPVSPLFPVDPLVAQEESLESIAPLSGASPEKRRRGSMEESELDKLLVEMEETLERVSRVPTLVEPGYESTRVSTPVESEFKLPPISTILPPRRPVEVKTEGFLERLLAYPEQIPVVITIPDEPSIPQPLSSSEPKPVWMEKYLADDDGTISAPDQSCFDWIFGDIPNLV